MSVINKRILLSASAVLALSGLASVSHADVVGKVEVKLDVSSGCQVTNGADNVGAISDFGTLDFGRTGPTWSNVLGASSSAIGSQNSPLKVSCSDDVENFTVAVNGGVRGNRTLVNSTAPDPSPIEYKVFRDAVRTQPFEINQKVQYKLEASTANVQLFGSIQPTTEPAEVGIYSDTLVVTIAL